MQFGHVSMREARAHLADVLDDAERGNVTFVTRHGRAVAAIAPPSLLEQVGHALDALPPNMDSAADIVLTTEDGSVVLMQVKAYGGGTSHGEQPEDVREASTPLTGDVLVVTAPPGAGKSAVLRQVIDRYLGAGRPLVLLDSSAGYTRSVVDADASGDLQPAGDPLTQPPGASAE